MDIRIKCCQDEAASIATNSYSIISKRSVEKIYLSHEPQFLHSFVPNFKRRAPLINRGYWLRTRAIESRVESFLTREGGTGCKAVVNLGCGYDALPFRMRTKGLGVNLFIDVDYPDLISRKSRIIATDPLFKGLIGEKWHISGRVDCVELESDWYRTIGCDLGDLQKLDRVLEERLLASESILFVAEVSITYMPYQKADALLKWSAKFKNGRMPSKKLRSFLD
jgi:tRNA wybutosine-synthesizing protein 4